MSEGLRELLEEENPDALLAEGFEDAMVGLARRCGQPTLAVYDYTLGVQVLMKRDGMSYEEAIEWMEFNVVGAWMGEHTPVWLMHAEHTATDVLDLADEIANGPDFRDFSSIAKAFSRWLRKTVEEKTTPTSEPDPPKTGGG